MVHRNCAQCTATLKRGDYSANQWRKGEGSSLCYDCVDNPSLYRCRVCDRCFDNNNQLNMHLQVHRPRNVACPVCGERRFRSGANAVQHVESRILSWMPWQGHGASGNLQLRVKQEGNEAIPYPEQRAND
ncbi:hypothetical protein ACA910_005610 [Epithemia clementina (nom. ined.)]